MGKFPGNPTTGQIAAAEQRYAAVKAAVDDMLTCPPTRVSSDAEMAIGLAASRIVDALVAMTDDDADIMPAAFLLSGELLRRLHEAVA